VEILVHCVPEDINTYIVSDKHWLAENILCLLSNAVKYSNSGCVTLAATLQHNVKKYSFDEEDEDDEDDQIQPLHNKSSSFYGNLKRSISDGEGEAVESSIVPIDGSGFPIEATNTGLRQRTSAAAFKTSSITHQVQDGGQPYRELNRKSLHDPSSGLDGLTRPKATKTPSSVHSSSVDTSLMTTPRDKWEEAKTGTATGTATVSSDFGTATGSEQHVRAARTQSMVRITVEDNGIGLSAEARRGLFRVLQLSIL
jgi:hypothetical protein